MPEISVSSQPMMLNQLLESLGQAEGACSQLIHILQDPRFMIIREAIELTREGVTHVATFSTRLSEVRPA